MYKNLVLINKKIKVNRIFQVLFLGRKKKEEVEKHEECENSNSRDDYKLNSEGREHHQAP